MCQTREWISTALLVSYTANGAERTISSFLKSDRNLTGLSSMLDVKTGVHHMALMNGMKARLGQVTEPIATRQSQCHESISKVDPYVTKRTSNYTMYSSATGCCLLDSKKV